MSDLLDQGIIAYLQRGVAASPRADAEAVRALAPGDSDELLTKVRSLIQESLAVPIDWSTTTLSEAGRTMAVTIHERHPTLGPDAVDALAWNFTFSWR